MASNITTLLIPTNVHEITVRCIASSSESGSMMACSYLPLAMTEIKVEMERNSARIPKSSGLYILVRIGLIKSGIA